MHLDPAAAEPLDRLQVEVFGGPAVAEEGARPRLDPERPVGAAQPGSFGEPVKRVAGELRLAASRGGLDQFDQRPREQTQGVVFTGALRGGESGLVAAETVVQHRSRVLGQSDRPSLAPAGRVFAAGLDQLQCLGFLAAPGGEHQRAVHERRVARCLRDRIRLFDQRRSGGKLSGMHVDAGAVGRRERKNGERAGIASEPKLAGRQLMPRLVLPQIGRDTARQPKPTNVVLGCGHRLRIPQPALA